MRYVIALDSGNFSLDKAFLGAQSQASVIGGDREGRGGGGYNFTETVEQTGDEDQVSCLWPWIPSTAPSSLSRSPQVIKCTATK